MITRRRMTPQERQQIIDLRRGPPTRTYNQIAEITRRPYNTIAHVCRDAHLQREAAKIITIVHDPSNLYKLGPSEFNQADLSSMLLLSDLQEGFAVTIGQHRLVVRNGCWVRDDGVFCPPNKSSTLKWYALEGTK